MAAVAVRRGALLGFGRRGFFIDFGFRKNGERVLDDRELDNRGFSEFDYHCYGNVIALLVARLDFKVWRRTHGTPMSDTSLFQILCNTPTSPRYAPLFSPGGHVRIGDEGLSFDYDGGGLTLQDEFVKCLVDQEGGVTMSREELQPAIVFCKRLACLAEWDLFGAAANFLELRDEVRRLAMISDPVETYGPVSNFSVLMDESDDSKTIDYLRKDCFGFNMETIDRARRVCAAGGFNDDHTLLPLFRFEYPHVIGMVNRQKLFVDAEIPDFD